MNYGQIARLAGVRDGGPFAETMTKIEAAGELLSESTAESDRDGRLPSRALEALRDSGAMHMRVPVELGGPDFSIAEQMMVISRIARYDSASAWCTMVANNGIGAITTFLSDDGVAEVFADGERPIGAAVAAPGGSAIPVEGGYRIDGTWRFCSNVFGAEWIRCTALVEGDPERPILIAVPQRDIRVLKTWNVIGLKGTGSSDFAIDGAFVPSARAADMREGARIQLRGTRNYSKDVGGVLAVYEHTAFAIGVARRAHGLLESIIRENPSRGGDREVVRTEFSRLTIELDAAEYFAYAVFASADAPDAEPQAIVPGTLPAVTTYVTELAQRCAIIANRRAGSQALYLPNPLEGIARDLSAALAHALVNDRNYAVHGANLLQPLSEHELLST